jgi:L-alanine-DL-glutamate epimerase-like enolase superfamily enzyme
MKALVARIAALTAGHAEAGHPIDLTWTLEPAYHQAAAEVSRELNLAEPIPPLCTLVAASAFDAALHDAFGKVHGLNCYHTYGPDFLTHDLGHYLGPEFAGERLDRYLTTAPTPRLPLYHLIGALDPLEDTDVSQRLNDGLPETLPEWIRADGLTHLKIKLNGDDLTWDVARVVRIERVTAATQQERGVGRWYYSLDFNERCPHVDYLLEFLAKVREQTRAGFERIQYIEQPTARDLKAHRANIMHQASRVRPVVIDESLLDLESLRLAREMGYTGAALKACKGQSQSLVLAAAAQKYGLFLCVQDLTCPGASLIHSAGLAAHVPGVAAIETNARQYVPAANAPWAARFPGIFHVTDGTLETGVLTGPGLGAVPG